MKILLFVFFLLQLTTVNISANGTYNQYIKMKKSAYSLYEKQQSKAALSLVKDFIKKHPDSVRAKNLLAVLYYWNGDFAKSKTILKAILEKEDFPQASSLLKSIELKEGKKVTIKKSKVKEQASSSDLMYLVKKIQKDPNDALSRKILALHYAKIGNSKQANYFANEVLKIDPDDREMLTLVDRDSDDNPYDSKIAVNKAFNKLNQLYKDKKYNSFINLYNSLEHNNVVMPTDIHINALYCAIELKLYQKAKSILHIYRMPKSRYLSQIKELIDEKLMLSRFASSVD